MPKYLEYQFNLTPGQAAMVVGCLSVPAGAGGTLAGGYLLKRLNLDRTGAIKLYLFCQAIIIPLYFGFLIHCPTPPIQGVNYFNATGEYNKYCVHCLGYNCLNLIVKEPLDILTRGNILSQ